MNWIGHEKYLAEGNWILYQVTLSLDFCVAGVPGGRKGPPGEGGGVLPYMGYMGMCGSKGYGFQT